MTSDVAGSRSFVFGPFKLTPARQSLVRDDKPVRIGGRALDLLTALVERPGELVTKSELLAQVWPDTTVDENNLKVNMATLRRILEDGPSTPYIATVVGRGYRFVASVQTLGPEDAPPAVGDPRTVGPSTANHNLPISTTRIFGRAEAITAIRRDLDQARLVSIVGSGGIGKTTVAIAVAEQAIDAFSDGVWLVDLAPLADGERTVSTIATVLGVQAHSPDVLGVLCEFLRDRQLLLLLDNCEHIIDGVAACADRILATAAGVRILATSREPLRMTKERVRRLAGLDAPPDSTTPLDARSALDFPAVQLFVERATEGHEAFQLADSDAAMVAQICRNLDGLALAIELAATRVGTFGVAGLLRQLDDRLRLLTGWRVGPERQRTLVATLDWSYALLDEREATILRAVSVFAGTFDLEGAASVVGIDRAEVLEALASLAAKSLLVVEPTGDGVACRLLETTRAYSTGRLRSSGEENDVRTRHADHVCTLLGRGGAEWASTPALEWGATYGPVVDDLRLAVEWASRSPERRSLHIRLTVAGALLWNHLSLTEECRVNVSCALAELAHENLTGTSTEMLLQMFLAGATLFTRGPIPDVLVAVQRAFDIAERVGDIDFRLRSMRMIGAYHGFCGDNETACGVLQEFIVVATQRDPSAVPDGETHLGITELHAGRLDSARSRLERLNQRLTSTFDDARLARFLYDRKVDVGNVLSYAQWLTGSPDSAAHTAASTVERGLEVKHGLSLSNALAVAACPVFYMSRRYEECERYVAMLEREVRQQGIVIWSPNARFFRGALACTQDATLARGIADLERSVTEFHAINHGARRSWILAVLAEALVRGGRVADAATTIAEALAWKSDRWCRPEVVRIQASILFAQGNADEAEAALLHAIEDAGTIGGLSWKLRAAVDLARFWSSHGRVDEARTLLVPIYARFTEGFATRDLLDAAELITLCGGVPPTPTGPPRKAR